MGEEHQVARIACQVLQRPDRVTFIWSQDNASFEPYHLGPKETEQFYRLADEARQHLASVLAGDNAQLALARSGYELHQLIFRARESDSLEARRIHQWLHDLHEQKSIDSLEIVSDIPGRIPWNVVCEQAPEETPNLDAFWGVRYPLTTGRRVNPLRLDPIFAEQDVLLVLDPLLPAQQQEDPSSRWNRWRPLAVLDPLLPAQQQEAWKKSVLTAQFACSAAQLREALTKRCPDLICWVGDFQNGSLVLGEERITLAELRRLIDEAKEGNPEPLVFLHVADSSEVASWTDFLGQAALTFPGLMAWESAQAAKLAEPLGRELFGRLMLGGQPLGQILRDLRHKQGWPALGLTAFCPPYVQFGEVEPEELAVSRETTSDVLYSLPEEPYKPFASLDREDRPLLAGRDRDIARFAGLLDEPNSRLILLHGGFGVGKSSFLRAGVVPFLEDNSLGYFALRDRTPEERETPAEEGDYPVLTVRASRDLAGQLAEALCVFCAQPFGFETPLKDAVTVPLADILHAQTNADKETRRQGDKETNAKEGDAESAVSLSPCLPVSLSASDLWKAFQKDADLLGRLLDALSSKLPHDLVILIEKGEDLITQARSEEDRARRKKTLHMLNRAAELAPRCKVILSVRTDFLGRVLDDFPPSPFVRQFLLPELGKDQLLEILTLSTANEAIPFTDEVPFAKYRLGYSEELAQQLVDQVCQAAVKTRQSAVALLHVGCALLERRARIRNVAPLDKLDLKSIGNIEDAASKFVDDRLGSLSVPRTSQIALRELLQGFFSCEPGGTVACDTIPVEQVKKAWRGSPEEARNAILAAEAAGLLEVQHLLVAGQEGSHTVLANDSLARVAQDWTDQKKTKKFARSKVIDMWFLALPLICLAAASTWYFANWHFHDVMVNNQNGFKKLLNKTEAEAEEAGAKTILAPAYLGCIAQAELAWQTGDLARVKNFLEKVVPATEKEVRGFEWYYLWRLANSERTVLRGRGDPVVALAVSPDGRMLASAERPTEKESKAAKITLWTLPKGSWRSTIQTADSVNALAFSGDGEYLAWAGADKAVHVTGLSSDPKIKLLSEHTDTVLALVCYQNVLISAGADKKVIVWDLEKGVLKLKHTLADHTAAVHALALDTQRKRLATGGADGQVIIWDLSKDGPPVKMHVIAQGGIVHALAFSPDGKTLVSGGYEAALDPDNGLLIGGIHAWDPATGKARATPKIQLAAEVVSLAFRPDGKMVASAGKDNFIRLWDADSLRELGVIKGHSKFVSSVIFADIDSLVSGSLDGDVKIWQPTPTANIDVLHSGTAPMTSAVLSQDDKLLAGASKEGNVYVWDLATRKLLRTIEDPKSSVTALAFGRAGNTYRLAAAYRSGKEDGLLKVWNMEPGEKDSLTAKAVFTQSFPGKVPECLAFANDAKNIVWGGSGGSIELWDVEGKLPKKVFVGPKKMVRCLDINREENLLAAGSDDESIYLWELDSGKSLPSSPLQIQRGPITSFVAYDRKILLFGGSDGAAMVWQIDGNRPLYSASGHLGPVASILFSPRVGLFTAGWDHTIKIWKPSEVGLMEQFTLKGHTGPVRSIALTRDGQTLVSAGDDGTVRLWRAPRKD